MSIIQVLNTEYDEWIDDPNCELHRVKPGTDTDTDTDIEKVYDMRQGYYVCAHDALMHAYATNMTAEERKDILDLTLKLSKLIKL